ncbi:lysylphosphatidylglycerol synthase transmembrane domain-containing protein [Marinilabilia salmonicolor]|uniref:lysylphosphatidylglycerol synthase transmembrane domain-containing protein n=1 Tax=Marinilabilia salmonicolor TaxID=989 RepID=UPI001F33BBF1|nr:lysylphosphatidylglycerol synthase domain-containing protein [Marinilabilia salmonicolor]
MTDNSGKIIKSINPSKIILPILIGLSVTGFLLYREFEPGSFSFVRFTFWSVFWLLVSFLLMAVRDFGYMLRIRILTNNELSWKKVFNIIMLWEFTSAITPSAIGGTSVAIFFLNKEGVRLGRSTAVVMVTSFLDELYFILTFPIILLLLGRSDIFILDAADAALPWYKNNFFLLAMGGYSIKLLYTLILSYGLFINPRGLKWLLLMIFKLPIIRKWRPQANESGTDLIQTSKEFSGWPLSKWIKAFAATFFSWTSRYWVVNTLIITFLGIKWLNWEDHFHVFAKQLVMWIMMLISPLREVADLPNMYSKNFLRLLFPWEQELPWPLCGVW